MKLFRYKKPSFRACTGLTRVKRAIKKTSGLNIVERYTKPSRVKQSLKQKVGLYSPPMAIVRQTIKGKLPSILGFFSKKK